MKYRPVIERTLFHGAMKLWVFGAQSRNWSYAGSSREEIEQANPGVTEDLREVMEELNLRCVLVPKPTFNACVAREDELQVEILPDWWRGANADGVLLRHPGISYMLASADCLLTVVYDDQTHRAVALHCGRDALVDRGRIRGAEPRRYESVIDAGFKALSTREASNPGLWQVHMAAGIWPDQFSHPTTDTIEVDGHLLENKRAQDNRLLIDDLLQRYPNALYSGTYPVVTDRDLGTIHLPHLVVHQLRELGIPARKEHWDQANTAMDRGPDGSFLYHSNRRDARRNLVIAQLL